MDTRTLKRLCIVGFLTIFTVYGLSEWFAYAQEIHRPIDMMIVVDNSCSMFPDDKIVPGCEVWGNDPDFLRIVGADLFVARLGFAEVNETEYQAGVVSLGQTPRLVSLLQPLHETRDTLAQAITDPDPELATGIIPALELTYHQLRESPNRRPTNLPAVILITDGIPYPRSGQSDTDIERLVSENPDIPLFIMLLQVEASEEYEQYISFWQQMQARYTHVFVYRIEDAGQISGAYNTIVAQLQNTIPSEGISIAPGDSLPIFVSRYVRRIIITTIHETDYPKGTITIKDPEGNLIRDDDPGVNHFRGDENPVEVISISPPRLRDDLKEDIWTITSDAPVTIFLDRQGAYRISFLAPDVSLTDVTNVYMTRERQTPNRELVIRFNLLDEQDNPIVDVQPIEGQVIYPNGEATILHIPPDLYPDANGVYEIRFASANEYPPIIDQPGRFTFILNAGLADDRAGQRVPIATARLLADVGRAPYIETIVPETIVCAADQPSEITLTIGDYDLAQTDTLRARIFSNGEETTLTANAPGTFTGDIAELCTSLLANLACSTQQEATLRVRMTAQRTDGFPLPLVERELSVQVVAPSCAPTPTPPPTPTPLPPPTPIPDSDEDGWNDLEDKCPDTPGIYWFDGCPFPLWLLILLGILGSGLLLFLVFWLWPWIKVRTIAPPPRGYVLICRTGERRSMPKSVHSIGLAKRQNKVTIGGDRRKAHIYVKGLKPVEFVVERQRDQVVLLDAEKGIVKRTFNRASTYIRTSNSDVVLRVSLDQSRLRC